MKLDTFAPPPVDFDPRDVFDELEPGSDDDEDPRVDLGYREPTPVMMPTAIAPAVVGDCIECGPKRDGNGHRVAVALCQRPGRVERTICADCQGKDNRNRVELTRECIKALKEAAALGNSHEEHRLVKQLTALVGDHQAGETTKAIRERLETAQTGRARR